MKNNVLRRLRNGIFHRVIGRRFFEISRDYYEKPSMRKKAAVAVNQFLNERGWQTPLILTKDECLAYWASMGNESASVGNRPVGYATKGRGMIDVLHSFWSPEVTPKDEILELGCNCGVNLYWLKELGYSHLSGVEVSPAAIGQLRESFPALAVSAKFHLAPMDQWLKSTPSKSYDVVFTMGVSMHIHPADNFVFREMTRIARKYVCTVEPEPENSNYVFSRNYQRVFERLGATQVKGLNISRKEFPELIGYFGCDARLFKVQ